MDISPLGIAKSIIPQLHIIISIFIFALLGISSNASVQDLFTELMVVCVRPILGRPISIARSQAQFSKNWIILGPMWISRYMIAKPEDNSMGDGECQNVSDAVLKTILSFKGKDSDWEVRKFDMPDVVNVETEWTGYRRGVSIVSTRPRISEAEQYQKLLSEVEPDSPVILYLHGGAFCLMDPAQLRFPLTSLARRIRGRCLSVRYRLAPQNMFPSALIDAFVAYLSLISPPSDAFHEAVPPSQIVMAGDSSGGGLAASLTLLLLTLPRIGITHIRFHGRNVPIVSPPAAGLVLNSAWLDISRALPSVHRYAQYDIITPPSLEPHLGGGTPDFPHDSVWPATPPRVETYCLADMVLHPLVSPLTASRDLWVGCPPVYACVGWEFAHDETEVTVRRMYEAGVTVVFEGYVGMPHCFSVILFNYAARTAFTNMAAFCTNAVTVNVKETSKGTWTDKFGQQWYIDIAKLGLVREPFDSEKQFALDDDTVDQMLIKSRKWRVEMEEKMLLHWSETANRRKT